MLSPRQSNPYSGAAENMMQSKTPGAAKQQLCFTPPCAVHRLSPIMCSPPPFKISKDDKVPSHLPACRVALQLTLSPEMFLCLASDGTLSPEMFLCLAS